MRRRIASTGLTLLVAAVALACSAPAADGDPAPTSTGASTGSGAGGPAPTAVEVTVSFVAEEGVGQAPALFRLVNETPDETLSLTLADGQAFAFYLVEPAATTDYIATASADLWTEANLSIHTTEGCVRKPFEELTGPLGLEPGHAYTLRVTIAGGFFGEITEDPLPPPFVGIRSLIQDPIASTNIANTSTLMLSIPGAGATDEHVDDTLVDVVGPYTLVSAEELEVALVRFTDRNGDVHESAPSLVLQDHLGYTAYLSSAPLESAEATVVLEQITP